MKKDDRFIIVHKEGSSFSNIGLRQVLVDRETGVNYLFVMAGYGAGMTVLYGADGKPIITPVAR